MTVPITSRLQSRAGVTCRVLSVTTSFPSACQPVHGVFVKERLRYVAALPDIELQVVQPVPYFPPVRFFRRWYPWSQVPLTERVDGLNVRRRRFLIPPIMGGYVLPDLMRSATLRAVQSVSTRFAFDVIDAHFIYPSGVLAVELGRRYNRPVVITCRGSDILVFPKLPIIGDRIRWAIDNAQHLIAVSREIAERIIELGGSPRKVSVIPNGVDVERFRPIPQQLARRKLGLPTDRPIILSVGYRLKLKGFDLLVDAVARLRDQFPRVLAVIVGGEARWERDYLPEILKRMHAHGIEDHVLLAGERPPDELPWWYNAADIFCLLSSREGTPNALMEALACGAPAVATAVGGIPDVLHDRRLGLLVKRRTAADAALALRDALTRRWNRSWIRSYMLARSWQRTAQEVRTVFYRVLSEWNTARLRGSNRQPDLTADASSLSFRGTQ